MILLLTTWCVAVTPAPQTSPSAPQSGKVAAPQADKPASQMTAKPDAGPKGTAILTQAEADSLQVKGDSLLAQAGIKEVPVGVASTTDIIYILVIVLLAVVIIRVIS
ncbi:MAG TPA: hypothetical protein VGL38_11870 [bacterium]